MNVWNKYLCSLSNDRKIVLINILEIAKKHSPDAIEAMPYGVPGLKFKGSPLIAVAAHKNHYGVYPFSPKAIEAAKPMIGNKETAMGTIRFAYDDLPPTEDLIKALIDFRLKEIA